MGTFVLTSETPNDEKKPPTLTRSLSLKLIGLAAICALGVGIGVGYAARSSSSQVLPLTSSSGSFSQDYCGYPTLANVTLAGPSKNISGTLEADHVRNHILFDLNQPYFSYGSYKKHSLACVDARADHPIIGTPGGDLAEFAIGLNAYFNATNQQPTVDSIRSLFQDFLKEEITEDRPFYFHTDDTRLRLVYKNLTTILGRNVTILPSSRPDSTEADLWLRELTESYAQGCGHIRLMIQQPQTYGLKDNFIIRSLIRVFYEEFWSRNREEKKLLDFTVKLGPLIGGAIAIVSSDTHSKCSGASPRISPNIVGSTLFVYHPHAATGFRQEVLAPFFAKRHQQVQVSSLTSFINALFDTQLTATLTNLAPANAVDLFAVSIL